MPNAKAANKPAHRTTGNVMEELGFSAQEIREMEIKQELWQPVYAVIKAQKLTQAQAAKALGIHQPDASLLLRGQIARFSIARLLQFAERMGLTVKLTVVPRKTPSARNGNGRVVRVRAAAVA